jgi:hypothetical protein
LSLEKSDPAASLRNKKAGPAPGFSLRQPGCLAGKILGFPPPPRGGFGFIVVQLYLIIPMTAYQFPRVATIQFVAFDAMRGQGRIAPA